MAALAAYCFVLEKYRENNKGPRIVSGLKKKTFFQLELYDIYQIEIFQSHATA